jgi:dienelactone hydrolase
MKSGILLLLVPALVLGEIRYYPGGKEIPHDQYMRVVSETESPVERLYIKTRDGLYVAAALRKPSGRGPFPALIHFHGAPGGRGMDQLVGWSLGATGSPVWERFLKEGFVVVVADYRSTRVMGASLPADQPSFVDDGQAVLEYVRALPYVDPSKVTLYGVSLGGNLVAHLIGRVEVHAAVLGAPAVMSFLGATPGPDPKQRWKNASIDAGLARRNIEAIQCPVLILVGTADSLIEIDRPLHDLMEKYGKRVRMEVYEGGYHDFCIGPQGQNRREPLMEGTLKALETSLEFVKTARLGTQ